MPNTHTDTDTHRHTYLPDIRFRISAYIRMCYFTTLSHKLILIT